MTPLLLLLLLTTGCVSTWQPGYPTSIPEEGRPVGEEIYPGPEETWIGHRHEVVE